MIESHSPRVLPDIDERDLEIVPLERSDTIPSRWYTDPEFHELDRRAIFSRSWQAAGHLGQLPSAGSHLVATVAGEPVIVVRDNDGSLRAFYNVCRHRGGPLAMEDGCASMLQCKYHGWTYRLDGSLRGVPSFDRVELFDRADFGLIPICVESWGGLIFVNLSEEELTPVKEVVAGIDERIAPMQLDTKRFHSRVVYDVACNWKVYVDNYLEGYHVPLVHPELFSYLDFNSYLTEVFRHYSLQQSPLRTEDNIYNADAGDAFYYFIYPNLMLNILPGRLQSNLVLPVAHDRTQVIFDYYYDDLSSPGAVKMIEEDLASSDRTQWEDIGICERVQQGLSSRAYDRGRFSVQYEEGVYHFQSLVKGSYRSEMER